MDNIDKNNMDAEAAERLEEVKVILRERRERTEAAARLEKVKEILKERTEAAARKAEAREAEATEAAREAEATEAAREAEEAAAIIERPILTAKEKVLQKLIIDAELAKANQQAFKDARVAEDKRRFDEDIARAAQYKKDEEDELKARRDDIEREMRAKFNAADKETEQRLNDYSDELRKQQIDRSIGSTNIGGNKKIKSDYTVKQLKTIALIYNVKTTKNLNGKDVNLKKEGLLAKLKRRKIIL